MHTNTNPHTQKDKTLQFFGRLPNPQLPPSIQNKPEAYHVYSMRQWVRLHDYNISQKVQVIVEHFKNNVMDLLGGQAKAMVVTGSRKEAVRYKLAFDKYVASQGYQRIHAMDDAILDSSAAHQEQMMQLLSDPAKAKMFAQVVFDLLSR